MALQSKRGLDMDILKVVTIVEKVTVRFKVKI